MWTDREQLTEQASVTACTGEIAATVLPSRFAETSATVLPEWTPLAAARQGTVMPLGQITVAGVTTIGAFTE